MGADMFTAILAFLFVGATEPTLYARPDTDKPFVGIGACQEWAAEELGHHDAQGQAAEVFDLVRPRLARW